MNDRGICDNGSCEAFHLAPDQLINLRQILQHYNNASYGDAYDKEPDKEDRAKLYFGSNWKSSTENNRKWNAHQHQVGGDVRAAHCNNCICSGGTGWSLKRLD